MQHFYKELHGWFDESILEIYKEEVISSPSRSHFVEVGGWLGQSASFMAVEIINSGKEIKFDCVDSWKWLEGENGWSDDDESLGPKAFTYEPYYRPFNNIYEKFLDNIGPARHVINPIKLPSKDAAKLYEDKSLDFVFIDADHAYENVKDDIHAWYTKVKSGGKIAGHDYDQSGVRRAVGEFFKNKVNDNGKSWSCEV